LSRDEPETVPLSYKKERGVITYGSWKEIRGPDRPLEDSYGCPQAAASRATVSPALDRGGSMSKSPVHAPAYQRQNRGATRSALKSVADFIPFSGDGHVPAVFPF
jgi:hypothetical protein